MLADLRRLYRRLRRCAPHAPTGRGCPDVCPRCDVCRGCGATWEWLPSSGAVRVWTHRRSPGGAP